MRDFAGMACRSDGEHRCSDNEQRSEPETSHHEVSQRGAARCGDDERG